VIAPVPPDIAVPVLSVSAPDVGGVPEFPKTFPVVIVTLPVLVEDEAALPLLTKTLPLTALDPPSPDCSVKPKLPAALSAVFKIPIDALLKIKF
jgi:hypothetical protein